MLPFFRRSAAVGAAIVALGLGACRNDNTTTPTTVPVPTNLTAGASATAVKLTWDSVPVANAYYIQRAIGTGDFVAIAVATDTTYTDVTVQPATTYRYRVAASDGVTVSDFSSEVSASTLVVGPRQLVLSGHITADRTLSADTTYVLSGFVKVDSGATLHIQAGTRIVGDTLVAGSSLWILRGAKIDAIGTAVAPIVFTSAREAGNRAPGDWGGIVIVGRGIVNRSVGGGATDIPTRGPASAAENYAAGADSADNSGAMRYVRVEFAGYSELPDQGLGAVSSYAVGGGTRYEYVQAMESANDAFAFYGGSVEMRYVVSYEAGDDHFDWTEGFRGRGQFLIGFQSHQVTPLAGTGSASADPHGFEGDGCELGTSGCASYFTAPYTMPVWANFTLVGPGSGVTLSGVSDNDGSVLRRGSGGSFLNGVIARWQGTGWNVRDAATDSLRRVDSLSTGGIFLAENGGGDFDAANACTDTGDGGSCGTAANFPNITSTGLSAASLFLALPASGGTPSTGAFDWTPAPGSPLVDGGVTTPPGRMGPRLQAFFGGNPMPVTSYAGAAPPAGPKWWEGWTNYTRN